MRTYADTGTNKQTYPSFLHIRVHVKLRSFKVSQLSSSNWNFQQQTIDGEVQSQIYNSEEEIDSHHHQQHYNNKNNATTVHQKKDSVENNSTTYRVIGD